MMMMVLSHIVILVEEIKEDIDGDRFGKRFCVHQLSVDSIEQELYLRVINISNRGIVDFGMFKLVFGDTTNGVERFGVKEVRGISV